MISFETPRFLFLSLLIIPAVLFSLGAFSRISKSLGLFFSKNNLISNPSEILKRKYKIRTLLWACAWLCFSIAISGPTWGVSSVPVQKNGYAVSFVFDISNSMTSGDGQTDTTDTRLEAASAYATSLLNRFETKNVAVSTVLTKGDSIVAVPLTEDLFFIQSLVSQLSPALLTSQGSNIGSGIEAGIRSFPPQQARNSTIIVFTDGEETVTSLEKSIKLAIEHGISVVLLGFGTEEGSECIAGDGETIVKTYLNKKQMQESVKKINSRLLPQSATASYFDAFEKSSAANILNIALPLPQQNTFSSIVTYETQSVKRYKLFLVIAIILFCFGFIVSEFYIPTKKGAKKILSVFLCLILFTSCSTQLDNILGVLDGTLKWYKKDYQNSIASFLETETNAKEEGDEFTSLYASVGLVSSYLMQNETDAAMKILKDIPPDSSNDVMFSTFYNQGYVAYMKADYGNAVSCFKKALTVNPTNIDAKINYELSMEQEKSHIHAGIQEINPIVEQQENDNVKNAVFSVIRQYEQNQWKNREKESVNSGSQDY